MGLWEPAGAGGENRFLALSFSFAIGFLNGDREPDWQVLRGDGWSPWSPAVAPPGPSQLGRGFPAISISASHGRHMRDSDQVLFFPSVPLGWGACPA